MREIDTEELNGSEKVYYESAEERLNDLRQEIGA